MRPIWATRDLRPGEHAHIAEETLPVFYRLTDGPRRARWGRYKLLKGVEHVRGLLALLRSAAARSADIVHFQWSVLPALDRLAIARFRRAAPVVLTVHDVTPFNGKQVAAVQRNGFLPLLQSVDRLIVHTTGARDALVAASIAPGKIDVIPHGLLAMGDHREARSDTRWRIVQFGRIQHYKGVDLLIEAVGRMTPADRPRVDVVVAGEPLVDPVPLIARARELGVEDAIDFRFEFMSEAAMAELLGSADAFVFPYRTIEASGVLYLVAALGRWIIASDCGAFPAMLGRDGAAGALVDPTDADALAAALTDSIGREPSRPIHADVPSWEEIGALTRATYQRARADWARGERA